MKTQQTSERNLNYAKPKLLTRRGETNQNPHLTKMKEKIKIHHKGKPKLTMYKLGFTKET